MPTRANIQAAQIDPAVRLANYFRTEPGRCNWPDRTIPDLELILIVEGRFEFIAAGATLDCPAGAVLAIWPGERHTFRRAPDCAAGTISCMHLEPMRRRALAGGGYQLAPRPHRLTDVSGSAIIHDLFRHAAAAFEGYSRYGAPLLAALARCLWLSLAERWRAPEGAKPSQRMEAMVEFLRARLVDPVTRQDLARHFGLTPEHVNYLFRKELRITPTQFLNRERCLLAYRLMHDEGLSVRQASIATGFSDPFYFSRVFKQFLGVAPSRV